VTPSAPEIARRVAERGSWYHRIEVAPGVVTPGTHDSPAALAWLDELGLPQSCAGQRVLDVGCRDGFFAFEMERRGAGVLAMDYTRADATGFALAAELLGSRVEHRLENVYNVKPEALGRFDMVLFLGVLYHLRDPVRALDAIRSVCRPGALLFVESVCEPPPAADASLPLWRFSRGDSFRGDGTTKWLPTVAGLEAVVGDCQFEVLTAAARGERCALAARAIEDERQEYYRRIDSAIDVPAGPNQSWRGRR
jgi:tRNA (mo5U34)-methyltransferase